ncbi:Lipase, GDSL [Cinnamomum micranthum f. kanehirae]|uniref:Lipase, GDSL n=1 Tax=Cinnamomum micranthum f. kanehirae TaxID=337451 RepID=A0A443NCU0_9MAGN|nr:Lipase, GDSL [Cinnamomum micranthum f. kanehirae]
MGDGGGGETLEYVYRISTTEEWEEFQKKGEIFGGNLDQTTGFIHLSKLHQVKDTLQRFFQGRQDLYLLQIDANKCLNWILWQLGEGLVYEAVDDGSSYFPHFYGPTRSFSPLPLDAVTKAEKLQLLGGELTCSLFNK